MDEKGGGTTFALGWEGNCTQTSQNNIFQHFLIVFLGKLEMKLDGIIN
jgi:hypothetical protein